MKQNIENLIFVLFLIGTLYLGGYTLYQINTTDFKGILTGEVSK